jgi:hypothetical protein
VNAAFDWRDHKIALGVTCGATVASNEGADAQSVIRNARLALSAARSRGPTLRFFTKSLDREAVAGLTLEREIRAAIELKQFRPYFQPQVDLRTGAIIGAEALARWIRPDGQQIAAALVRRTSPEAALEYTGIIAFPAKQAGASEGRQLSAGESTQPDWSGDGSLICYVKRAGGERQIYVVPSQGGTEKRISQLGRDYSRPQFSPQVPKE